MTLLREELDTEREGSRRNAATKYETEINHHSVPCQMCGQPYYLDDATYAKAIKGFEWDISEVRFYCDDCMEQSAEEEH